MSLYKNFKALVQRYDHAKQTISTYDSHSQVNYIFINTEINQSWLSCSYKRFCVSHYFCRDLYGIQRSIIQHQTLVFLHRWITGPTPTYVSAIFSFCWIFTCVFDIHMQSEIAFESKQSAANILNGSAERRESPTTMVYAVPEHGVLNLRSVEFTEC